MVDDGWCPDCDATTDGKCIHLGDGTTIPDPLGEILSLRRKLRDVLAITAEAAGLDDDLLELNGFVSVLRTKHLDLNADALVRVLDRIDYKIRLTPETDPR